MALKLRVDRLATSIPASALYVIFCYSPLLPLFSFKTLAFGRIFGQIFPSTRRLHQEASSSATHGIKSNDCTVLQEAWGGGGNRQQALPRGWPPSIHLNDAIKDLEPKNRTRSRFQSFVKKPVRVVLYSCAAPLAFNGFIKAAVDNTSTSKSSLCRKQN